MPRWIRVPAVARKGGESSTHAASDWAQIQANQLDLVATPRSVADDSNLYRSFATRVQRLNGNLIGENKNGIGERNSEV